MVSVGPLPCPSHSAITTGCPSGSTSISSANMPIPLSRSTSQSAASRQSCRCSGSAETLGMASSSKRSSSACARPRRARSRTPSSTSVSVPRTRPNRSTNPLPTLPPEGEGNVLYLGDAQFFQPALEGYEGEVGWADIEGEAGRERGEQPGALALDHRTVLGLDHVLELEVGLITSRIAVEVARHLE